MALVTSCCVLVITFIIVFYRAFQFNSFLGKENDSNRVSSIFDFDATGDGLTNDYQAFHKAWKSSCSLSGKSTILIPRGFSFLLHPIDFAGPCKSKITLHISGTIIAPENPSVWDTLNPRKWIYFSNVGNLTIEGGGRIDGRGSLWWAQSCKFNKTTKCHEAPTALTFHKCTNLKLKHIELINSQQMHISLTNCAHVKASQLLISAPEHSPNTDGVHVSSSRHVTITDAFVRTGDDCVSIVGNSSHIQIHNFSCWFGHGISIGSLGGSESSEIVQHVDVRGAFLSNTSNGLRVKTWQGGKGKVGSVKFQSVVVEHVAHPIVIEQYYCDLTTKCGNESSNMRIENISYVGIRGTSARTEAVRFACSDASPCKNIYMEDVEIVALSGESRSFCWQAHGTSNGFVSPAPCLSVFQLNVSSNYKLQAQ